MGIRSIIEGSNASYRVTHYRTIETELIAAPAGQGELPRVSTRGGGALNYPRVKTVSSRMHRGGYARGGYSRFRTSRLTDTFFPQSIGKLKIPKAKRAINRVSRRLFDNFMAGSREGRKCRITRTHRNRADPRAGE